MERGCWTGDRQYPSATRSAVLVKLNTFQVAHSYFRNRLSHYRRLRQPRKKKAGVSVVNPVSARHSFFCAAHGPRRTARKHCGLSAFEGQSGRALLHCICPLMTQSGHTPTNKSGLHAISPFAISLTCSNDWGGADGVTGLCSRPPRGRTSCSAWWRYIYQGGSNWRLPRSRNGNATDPGRRRYSNPSPLANGRGFLRHRR